MSDFDIPENPSRSQQLLMSAIVLLIVAVIVAILAKVIIGFIIFLLAAGAGVGSQVIKDGPLDRQK